MNLNQIMNMALRALMRRAVNAGVNAGINKAASLANKGQTRHTSRRVTDEGEVMEDRRGQAAPQSEDARRRAEQRAVREARRAARK